MARKTPTTPFPAPSADAPAGLADAILAEAPIGVFRSTVEGRYLYANRYLARLTGHATPEDMLAAVSDIAGQVYVDPGRRAAFLALLEAGQRVTDFEYERRRTDGSSLWVAVSARGLRDDAGRLWAQEGFVTDIDARKRAEAEAGRRGRILEAVGFAAKRFLAAADWADCLPAVLEQLGAAAEVSRTYVFENVQHADGRLAMSQRFEWCAPGVAPQIGSPELKNLPYDGPGTERLARTLPQGQPFGGLVRDLPAEERAVLEPQGIRSILVVPIFVQGRWWGFLGFDDCRSERGWSDPELESLTAAAGIIGAGLDKARVLASLRKSEELYRSVMEAAADPLLVTDAAGRVTFLNPAFRRTFGWSLSELLGRVPEFVPPAETQRAEGLMDRVLGDETVLGFETRRTTRDGRTLEVSVSAAPVRDVGGRTAGMVASLRDVTAAKAAEEALRRSEARLRSFLENIQLIAVRLDEQGRVAFANEFLLRSTGRSRLEVLGRDWFELFIPEGIRDRVREVFRQTLARGETGVFTHFENEILAKDGRRLTIAWSNVALKDHRDRIEEIVSIGTDITAHRRAEEALKESEANLRAILDNTEDVVLRFDRQARHLYANQAIERYLRLPPEEVLGKTQRMLGLPEAHCRQLESWIARVFTSGLPLEREFQWPAAAGQVVFNLRLFPESGEDGALRSVLAFARDVTAQRRLESDFLNLFSQMAEGVALHEIIRDADGTPVDYRFLAVNPAFERLTGLRAADILGRTVREVLPATEDFWIKTYGRVALSGQPARFTGFSGAIGRRFEASAYCPQTGQFAVVFSDVTDRKKMLDDLVAAKERAEAANRAKSEFLANMSHEVRTPLSGLFGMLQLALGTELTAEQRDFLTTALATGKSLLAILNDILDFSRMEAGALSLEARPFDLRASLKVVLDNFRLAVEEKGLSLLLEVDPALPPVVVGDEGRVRQVLFNLLGNAIKFTPGGSITLEIHALPGRSAGELRLVLAVSDTGIGIPDDRLADIFQPFTQVDGSYTRRYQGTGLGLGIVKRLVELMGGSVAVDSEPGQGTTVHLVVSTALPGPALSLARERRQRARAPGARLRVLVAEDSRINRILVIRVLEKLGHEAVEARDGREALALLAGRQFDLLLLDVQMPEVDGLEVTRRVREGRDGVLDRTIPIIAMTAHAMKGDREFFLDAGMDGYIAKPFDLDQFGEVLREVLGQA